MGKYHEKSWYKRKGLLTIVFVAVLFVGAIFYVSDYYHSDESVKELMQESSQASVQKNAGVSVSEISEGLYLDGPGDEAAVIFYPGAKVEYTAYLPLLYRLAGEGADCFLIKMPCNLAILGQNKAEKIMEAYEYEHWYISGHSLGGAMAASWAAGHPEELEGLILLAAYPTKELESDSLSVLSVYGSEDGVLNMEKLEEGRELMPPNYTELCIEGGNHAGFGNYGEQKGDKKAEIDREEQQKRTVEAVVKMMRASLAAVGGKEYLLVTAKANGPHQTEQFHILDAENVYSQIGGQRRIK